MRTARALAAAFPLLLALFMAAPASAQAARWEQAETEHFLFIYEPRDRASADELLDFCEEVYTQVTGFLGAYPAKVPCILRGRQDDANGVTQSFPSRIDLYLAAPTDHFLGARTESWLRALLVHELTHFVHQSMDTGFFHALSRVFGQGVSSYSFEFLPLWMIEGPAVKAETLFTSGGRGRNPLFEILTSAPIEEGNLFSLAQAGYSSAFPPAGRKYAAGYALVDHLLAAYGEDAFTRIMAAYLAFPFFGPWAAIRKVTGKDAEAVFADMREALASKDAAVGPARGGSLVTPERIGDWTRPQATANGLYVYRRDPWSFPAIVRWDPATGTERVLLKVDLLDPFSFTATADGRTVYLSSLSTDRTRPAEEETIADLFSLDVGTDTARQLTRGAHIWHPAVSPDGSSLVAVQGSGSYTRLVSVDTGTGAMRVLFSRAGANVYTPVFSPDGRKLAFVFNLRGFQDVYAADFDALGEGSVPLEDPRSAVADVNVSAAAPVLGPDPFGEYFPAFLDDRQLLFCSDRSGRLALYRADLENGERALLQEDPVAAVSGTRDGDSLVYSSYGSRGWSLKESALSDLRATPIDTLAGSGAYPPAPGLTGGRMPAKPYIDWPTPFMWLPNLALSQVGPGAADFAAGAGAAVFGGSLLGSARWSADAEWLIGYDQPIAGISGSTFFGPLGIEASSRLDYRYAGYWVESLSSGLTFTFTLFDRSLLDSERSLSVSGGIAHSVELGAYAPFTFAESLGAPAAAWDARFALHAGVKGNWHLTGGRIDFAPTAGIDASLHATVALPVLSLAAPETRLNLFTALNLPSPFAHHAVKLGLKAAYNIDGRLARFTGSDPMPRGFSVARFRSLPGGALAGLDYLAPIALLDQPLLFGWALTGAALGIHAEGIFDFGLAPAAFSPAPLVFLGGEVTVRLACGGLSIPLGIGLAAAVSTSAPSTFDPAADLRPYFFLGFDSFGGSVLSGSALAGRAAP